MNCHHRVKVKGHNLERPNPPLKSDPACIVFYSLSTFRYLGSAQCHGAGVAA